MNRYLIPVLGLGLQASCLFAQDKPDLSIPNQKYNYSLGLDIVSTFKQMDVDIDLKAFTAGMQDALAGKPILTDEEKKTAMDALSKIMTAKAEELTRLASEKNLRDGQDFLAANAKKEGVRTREVTGRDGSKAELQYKILRPGPPGPSPKTNDTVEVHYVGMSIDGAVFDSSVKRGFPATFGVTDVLPGWTEALKMMKAGDKWEIFLPPNLAYGDSPTPHTAPNATLIFQIELISFFTPTPASASTTVTPVATAK